MLHTASIYPATLDILKNIMTNPALSNFTLAGGTALALQIGHRISIDLDLFTTQIFDNDEIISQLNAIGKTEIIGIHPNILQLELAGVKLDLVKYPYSFVEEYELIENIRLLPIKTIALMKLLAISNRGAKKDFIDLYFLLKEFTINELIQHFENTFPHINTFHLFKSLTYFEDADLQADVNMLQKASWENIKKKIKQIVANYLKK